MDKNKILEAASKFVAKGAYDKAIKEYQKALDADPKDIRVLQKLGELHQKKNENSQAAGYFTRVAESYASDGFFLKAVALYKQVLKLDPNLIEVNIKLAELHQQLQLMGEAMAYYQLVANHFDKAGDLKRSLDVLKKMVDLDPDNMASRAKLGDLYARENMVPQALEEFRVAADSLKKANRTDDYLRVAERISSLDQNDLATAKELARLYLGKQDQKRALAKLQICFKADPRDLDTLVLLAEAFLGLGQQSKTISVYKEIAKLHDEAGRAQDSHAMWEKIAALDPNDADVAARKPRAQAAPAAPPAPAPVAAARPAAAAPPPAPAPRAAAPAAAAPPAAPPAGGGSKPPAPPPGNLGRLLTETDVYVKYGLHDKALEHLRKIFAVDPESIDAHEKAYAIYVAANNPTQAFEQLLNVLRLHTRSGNAERAQPFLSAILEQQPNHPEVPAFLAALRPGDAEVVEESVDDEILVDSSDEEIVVADEPDDALAAAAEETVSEDEPMAEASEDSAYDLGPPPVAEAPSDSQDQEIVADEFDEPLTAGAPSNVHVAPELYESAEAEASEEVVEEESAGDTLDMEGEGAQEEVVEEPAAEGAAEEYAQEEVAEAAAEEPVEAPPEQAAEAAPAEEYAQEEVAEAPPEEEAVEAPPEEEAVEAPPEEEPASEECEEAQFFIDQGLFDEAREILETVMVAYPNHVRARQLLDLIDGGGAPPAEAPAAAAPKDAFDLAAELADELGDAASAPAPAAEEDFQYSVEEVFSEFKKGLAKVVKPGDVDTHYDLGIAYKEMGLIDDAISEFDVARQGCLGTRKEIDCLTMMGMLEVSKGEFERAVDAYRKALASEHAAGDPEKALRYELATAFEGWGQAGKALGQFMKVQQLDAKYRDVAAQVARLAATTKPEQDGPSKPTRRAG